jgi:hypothetical protein
MSLAPLLQTSSPTTTHWVMMAFGAIVLVYMLIRPKAAKRKDPLESAPFKLSLNQQRQVEREMSNLLVELSEMARQITAQLDTRAAKLELLIKEADDRIRLLNQAQQIPPSDDAQGTEWAQPELREETREATWADARHTEVYSLHDQGRSVSEIAHQLDRPNGEIELILALRPRR